MDDLAANSNALALSARDTSAFSDGTGGEKQGRRKE